MSSYVKTDLNGQLIILAFDVLSGCHFPSAFSGAMPVLSSLCERMYYRHSTKILEEHCSLKSDVLKREEGAGISLFQSCL